MKPPDYPKQKDHSPDPAELARLEALDHFEKHQMDAFLQAIADELCMDRSAVMSLIYFGAIHGIQYFQQSRWNGEIKWHALAFEPFIKPGWTPVEVTLWLALHFRSIYDETVSYLERYFPSKADKLRRRNAINHLARVLFYNDPANRFEGEII